MPAPTLAELVRAGLLQRKPPDTGRVAGGLDRPPQGLAPAQDGLGGGRWGGTGGERISRSPKRCWRVSIAIARWPSPTRPDTAAAQASSILPGTASPASLVITGRRSTRPPNSSPTPTLHPCPASIPP